MMEREETFQNLHMGRKNYSYRNHQQESNNGLKLGFILFYFVSICHRKIKFCLMCVTNKRAKLGINDLFSFPGQDGEDLRCRLWVCCGPAGSAACHASVCCPRREGS